MNLKHVKNDPIGHNLMSGGSKALYGEVAIWREETKRRGLFLYLVSLEIITIYSLQVSSILNCAPDGFFTEEEILICIQFHTPVMDDLFELF